jgi:hypothetical protein
MTPEQIKSIRRLTGRCEANIEELVNLLSKSTDNYALRCAAWADLAAVLLSDIEVCQAQQQAAVEAENIECENIAKEYITFGLESPTDGDLIAARIRERRGKGSE